MVSPKKAKTVCVYLDGQVIRTFLMPGSSRETNTFSLVIDLSKLSVGKHTLYAQPTDLLDRVSDLKDQRTFTISGPRRRRSYLFGNSTVYIVSNGDSLWKLARTYLGRGARHRDRPLERRRTSVAGQETLADL